MPQSVFQNRIHGVCNCFLCGLNIMLVFIGDIEAPGIGPDIQSVPVHPSQSFPFIAIAHALRVYPGRSKFTLAARSAVAILRFSVLPIKRSSLQLGKGEIPAIGA